jgi:hypothetical protein
MIEREKIHQGTKLRLLRQRDGVAFGALGQVDTIREENWGTAWAFSVYWDDYRKKNRYSLFFTEADLEHFELVSASADCPTIEPIRLAKSSPLQLALPFTEAALYRGTEVVGTFEMSID